MGRTSKFLFPIPSRKHQSHKAPKKEKDPQPPPTPGGLSKAQRILGTDGELNIDTSSREEDHTWKSARKESSGGMSISISESTDDSDDEESKQEAWEAESGVLRVPQLKGKASSTLLGNHAENNEDLTDTSSQSRRLTNEGSSSTLRSHYERQNNPLLISQQTSSSSARDYALRKGLTAVAGPQRSPLFNVNCVDETAVKAKKGSPTKSTDSSPKKKPGRLDLSKLFPKPRQEIANPTVLGPELLTHSPSALSYMSTRSHAFNFPRPSRSATPVNSFPPIKEPKPSNGKSSKVKQQYSMQSLREYGKPQKAPQAALPPAAIPKRSSSRNVFPTRGIENLTGPQLMALHTPPASLDSSASPGSKTSQFSWKNARASAGGGSSTWDSGSAISTSSLNTRNSKKSAFDTTDLKNHSVLSLSSDEEDSDGSCDNEPRPESRKQASNHRTPPTREQLQPPAIVERPATASEESPVVPNRPPLQRIKSNKIPKSRFRESKFLPIPTPLPVNPRISGPWNANSSLSTKHHQEKIDTPPVSPTSMEFRQTPGRDSRFMAVNAQERALLEALRFKKSKMNGNTGKISEYDDEIPSMSENIPGSGIRRHSSTTSSIGSKQPYRSQSAMGLRDYNNRDSRQSTISGGSRGSIQSRSASALSGGSSQSRSASALSGASFQSKSSGATIRPNVTALNHPHQRSNSNSISNGNPYQNPGPHQRNNSIGKPPQHQHQRSRSRGNILLFLERPLLDPDPSKIQTAEPSPDLSEFYRDSFGLAENYRYYSDPEEEDSSPKPNLATIKPGYARRDSDMSPIYSIRSREEDEDDYLNGQGEDGGGGYRDGAFSPTNTVPNSARLSAVGGMGFPMEYCGNGHRRDSSGGSRIGAASPPAVKMSKGQRGYRSGSGGFVIAEGGGGNSGGRGGRWRDKIGR